MDTAGEWRPLINTCMGMDRKISEGKMIVFRNIVLAYLLLHGFIAPANSESRQCKSQFNKIKAQLDKSRVETKSLESQLEKRKDCNLIDKIINKKMIVNRAIEAYFKECRHTEADHVMSYTEQIAKLRMKCKN